MPEQHAENSKLAQLAAVNSTARSASTLGVSLCISFNQLNFLRGSPKYASDTTSSTVVALPTSPERSFAIRSSRFMLIDTSYV